MIRVSSEIRIGIALIVLSIILFAISPEKVYGALQENLGLICTTLFLTVIAVVIAVVIHYAIPPDFIRDRLTQNKIRYLFYATVLGIITPGPVYAVYPIVFAMKMKGIKNPILVSYITGQTLLGPARIPFEIGLFGVDFFLYRLALAVVMGPLAGILYGVLSKRFPDTA